MDFRLNHVLNLYINKSPDQINLIQMKATSAIRDLAKLYDLESISDEELKKIIAKYYKLYIDVDQFLGDEHIYKSILKSSNVTFNIVQTDIITMVTEESQELSYLDAMVYYAEDSGFDINHVYTYEELQELIKNRKIVVTEFVWSDKEITEEAVKTADLTEENKLPTLDKINEKNFWGYADIIIPRIKKRLQKSKVHRDIMSIINSMRSRLVHKQDKIQRIREELCSDESLREGYIEELKNLAVLCRANRDKYPKNI